MNQHKFAFRVGVLVLLIAVILVWQALRRKKVA